MKARELSESSKLMRTTFSLPGWEHIVALQPSVALDDPAFLPTSRSTGLWVCRQGSAMLTFKTAF